MALELTERDLADVEFCVGTNLRMVTRVVTQFFDEALRGTGLRVSQLPILAALAQVEQIGLTTLADQLLLDYTTLVRNLKPLERDGLVKTSRGEDRRRRMIELTPAGEEKLNEAYPLWQEAQSTILVRFGRGRWRMFLRKLDEIAEIVE